MTMIDNHGTDWHTINQGPDAELTGLRRALAAAELRAMKAVAAEDTAQFAFETAKRRADRLETAVRALLIERLMPGLPEALENSAEGIADCLIDDLAAGTPLEELEIDGHVQSWLDGKTEYEADGFTPAGLEAPF